jgi:hypothetical protein
VSRVGSVLCRCLIVQVVLCWMRHMDSSREDLIDTRVEKLDGSGGAETMELFVV